MKTAGELLGEAQRLRDLEGDATDPELLAEMRLLIAELEARARALENGA